jgi:hypothetical protein
MLVLLRGMGLKLQPCFQYGIHIVDIHLNKIYTAVSIVQAISVAELTI